MSLNVAIIGMGHWGPNYLRVLCGIRDVNVVAVADLNPAQWERVRVLYPNIVYSSDWQEIVQRKDVQAVVVATTTTAHYEVVKTALDSGKHVLCEKPLTASSAHAWELVGQAERQSLELMVGHIFLFNPGIQCVAEHVQAEASGRLYYLNAVRTNLGPFRHDVNAAWDLASHDIYIFNHITKARPTAVSALGAGYLRQDIEDIVFLTLQYPGGVLGHIHISWLDPKKVRQLTAVTENRMVTWDEYGTPGPVMIYDKAVQAEREYDSFGEFQLLTREGDVYIPRVKAEEPLTAEVKDFVSRCKSGTCRTSGCCGVEGAEVVDVLEAVNRSLAEKGRLVEIRYGR